MKRILVLGSACVDVVIRLHHLPVTEEDLHPESQRFLLGGCACNAANLLGRCGADVRFVTPVGLEGVFGPFVLSALKGQPWASPVLLPGKENGCCYCFVEHSGERTFLSLHGAEYTFDPDWMAPLAAQRFDYIYVCGLEVEEPTGEALTAWLERQTGSRIFYAPGPRCGRIPARRTRRLLALQPILHLNEQEALTLAGTQNRAKALAMLQQQTGQPVVCTLGSEGAALQDQDGCRLIPAIAPERIADTIGAGDAHAAAVLLGLSHGLSLPAALRLANQAGALAVACEGACLPDTAIEKLKVLLTTLMKEEASCC